VLSENFPVFVLFRFITIRTVTKRSFRRVLGILFSLGIGGGYLLSSIPELRTYKLLNLAGILYAFLGVLVLSEMIATDGWKDFCVRKLAPSIVWGHTAIPVGAILGSVIAAIMHKPSSLAVGLFSFAFWGWSLQVLWPFEKIVAFPQFPWFPSVKRDVETRWRWLGFFLVLGGVGAQLVAAVMDLRQ